MVVPAAVAVLIESAAGQEVSGLAYKHWHKVVAAADLEMMPAPVPVVVVVVVAVVARCRTFVVVVVERPIVVVYDAAVAVADPVLSLLHFTSIFVVAKVNCVG